jgi:hypothetical protein
MATLWQERSDGLYCAEHEIKDCATCRAASESKDLVNHPAHYQGENGIEAVDAIEAALGIAGCAAWCRGNAMKYLFRGGKKDDVVQDLEKALWYIGHEVKLRKKLKEKE